jgi:hypothetical protein
VQCHGGIQAQGKCNLLDTDHWFDRVFPDYGVADDLYKQEDFVALAQSPFPVLYDGGKDPAVVPFKTAFETIRQLNAEIKSQNERAGGSSALNFQLRAAEKWLQLHQTSVEHMPPYRRGFGDQTWDPNKDTHRKLLYFFNRYCYRCHSSVKFNVFDRQAVRARIPYIHGRVLTVDDPTTWMPQDRSIPGLQADGTATGDLKVFLDLLSGLEQEP